MHWSATVSRRRDSQVRVLRGTLPAIRVGTDQVRRVVPARRRHGGGFLLWGCGSRSQQALLATIACPAWDRSLCDRGPAQHYPAALGVDAFGDVTLAKH